MSFLTDRTVGTVLTVNDKIHIVDVDDLTGSPLGTSKQYTLQQLKTIVDSDTQDLENVLTYGNSTGIHDISLSDGKTLKADNGAGFVNLRNAGIDSDVTVGNTNSNIFFDNDVGTYLNDGIIGVDDLAGVSLVRNDQISFNLTASDFSRIGSFALVVNDVSDYNILNFPNYCGYSSSEGGKIKLGVKNSWIVGGAGAIAKTNNTAYANQLGFNSGEAFETILNYTTATANNTVTIQDGSGTLAFLTDVSSMYGVNGALTSDREVTLTSAFGISFLGGQTTLKGSGATSATKTLLTYNSIGVKSLIVDDNGSVYNNGKGEVSTNTAFGLNSLNSNTVGGTNNTAFGHNSLTTNSTGDRNTAFGDGALKLNTTSENTAFGWNAGAAISTGSQNVAVGRSALEINTIGTGNVAVGYTAGSKVTGSNNTAIGVNSLTVTTSASENTAIGANSLRNTGSGAANTSVGYFSLYSNTTGTGNVASGKWAITTNTIGSHNVGVGLSSQHSLLSGDNNVAIGRGSLFFNSTGDGNIALGNNAGEFALVSNELYIHNGLGVTNTTDEKTNSLIYGVMDATSTNQRLTINANVGVGGAATNTSTLNISNLPTSSAGLSSGDVWNNSGALTIV